MASMRLWALAQVAIFLGVEKMFEQMTEHEKSELKKTLLKADLDTNIQDQETAMEVCCLRRELIELFHSSKLINEVKEYFYK